MNSGSQIAEETIQAYRDTEYRVEGDAPFVLRVGCVSQDLLKHYKRRELQSCAFITAYNPFSIPLGAAENVLRDHNLLLLLSERGCRSVVGVGQHPSNEWPGEQSRLVWGISLEHASEIARQFQQNALIWAAEDAVPELILLR